MGKLRSVAARLGLTSKATEPPKEASVPPKPTPAPAPPVAAKPVEPTKPEPPKGESKHEPRPHPVLVNGKLIHFDGSLPLTERGLRACLLFPDNHRIYLKSRGQCRQFHGGEVLAPIPDDLEIFTRE